MDNFRNFLFIFTLSLLLVVTGLIFTSPAAAKTPKNIPQEVLDKVKVKELQNRENVPEVIAWEESLDGSIKEVTPINERDVESGREITSMAVPKDGYTYSFNTYSVNSPTRKWTYKSAGTVRVSNTRTVSANLTYTQQNSTTTGWGVSTSISGSGTIKASFLGKLSVSAGLTADHNKSWSKGTSYGLTTTVPAKSVAYLTAYAVGIYDSGKLVYKKYTSSGTLVGYYYETAGGTAISKNDANIELTDVDPL